MLHIPAEFQLAIFARTKDIDVAGNRATVVNVNVPNKIRDALILLHRHRLFIVKFNLTLFWNTIPDARLFIQIMYFYDVFNASQDARLLDLGSLPPKSNLQQGLSSQSIERFALHWRDWKQLLLGDIIIKR